jgi:hypothetical protein
MGSGRWDSDTYTRSSATRLSSGTKDFAHSDAAKVTGKVHDSLSAARINEKKTKLLESRDSVEHPASLPVLICFDVTGSNIRRAEVVQKKLCELMTLLQRYCPDVQVATASNDDFLTSGANCIQISEFESDNRIDDHLRNTWLIGQGGGNRGESYDLLLYAAARKIVTDAFEKRAQKGYMFIYADEPIFSVVSKEHVKAVFGDDIQSDIPIADMIREVSEKWNIVVLFPQGGYDTAYKQFVELFKSNQVIMLQDPDMICEQIASYVGLGITADAKKVTEDLKQLGIGDAEALVKASTPLPAASWKGGKATTSAV